MRTKLIHILKNIHFILLGLIVVSVLGFFVIRFGTFLVNKADSRTGVEEETYIDLNGQRQYCLIRGDNTENPVIIWVHGGPASPDTEAMYYLSTRLQKDYTFIAYNERGCGRTYFANMDKDPENKTASLGQLYKDLDSLVDYARERFHQDKVIIIGHSFGTMLGGIYSMDHPDKVSAYIGVGQMTGIDGEIATYYDAIDIAHAAGDDTTSLAKAFTMYESYPNIPNLLAFRKAADRYHPATKSRPYVLSALVSPYMSVQDLKWVMKQNDLDSFLTLNQQLFDEVVYFDIYSYGTKYDLPVGFISGSCDWVTPALTMEEYYEKVEAPKKDMVLMDGWGHMVPEEAPKELAVEIRGMLERLQ